jgi:hypothetical protein
MSAKRRHPETKHSDFNQTNSGEFKIKLVSLGMKVIENILKNYENSELTI